MHHRNSTQVPTIQKFSGSLFTQGQHEICIDGEEFYGIGQLLKSISNELSTLEDLIRCGSDSMADKRNGLDVDDDGNEMEEESDNTATNFELFLKQIVSVMKNELHQSEKDS